jgi:hypothetical protein
VFSIRPDRPVLRTRRKGTPPLHQKCARTQIIPKTTLLDVGKVANVVIATDDPSDVRTSVQQVFIEGVPIPKPSNAAPRPVSAPYSKAKVTGSHFEFRDS